jgi:hypothetical protein
MDRLLACYDNFACSHEVFWTNVTPKNGDHFHLEHQPQFKQPLALHRLAKFCLRTLGAMEHDRN